MKKTELMVGDHVLAKGHPVHIVGIQACCDGVDTFNNDDLHYHRMDDIEPIPLTEEILEKNGFIHRQSDTWGEFYTYKWFTEQQDKALHFDHKFNLSADPYEGSGFYWVPEMSAVAALRFRYVHELQHLMRMVGIGKEITL